MSSPFWFVLFCLLVGALYQAWNLLLWRKALLLAACVVFVASFWQGWRSSLPWVAFLAAGYAAIRWIRNAAGVRAPAVIVMVAAFIWLKEYTFVPRALLLPFSYVTIGLSYMFFRVLHLMIEARDGTVPEPPDIASYFHYTANFLTLISGPIQKYPDYKKDLDTSLGRRITVAENAQGLERIVKGLFKTNVLALVFSSIHMQAVDAAMDPDAASMAKVFSTALALTSYPLFLYCNFSGFIDLVIGGGHLIGLKLPENFNRPFASENFLEFWSERWHITLSSWLKTYVFNPLLVGLMRWFPAPALEPFVVVLTFFVTFFLVGVWHGQTSEILLFGVLLGAGVSVNKLYQMFMTKRLGRKRYTALSRGGTYVAFSRGLTFAYVSFTLLLFWSNWHQMKGFEAALGTALALDVCAVVILGSTVVLWAWESARSRIVENPLEMTTFFPYARTAASVALLAALITISLLMNQKAPDIVYKAF